MNYREAVERQIAGETNELNRGKELWEEIVTAYEQGGEDLVKSVLTTHGDTITGEFEELLKRLRQKL